LALIALPLVAATFGHAWVRMLAFALLYVLLALGLNIVVGYAGLLDLGYVAFYALGAYLFALLASPHLAEHHAWVEQAFPGGLHTPIWLVIPLAALLAGVAGIVLGVPTLKLRGDYLAIVTLGFGEIVRLLIVNLRSPINLTNGAHGISQIDPVRIGALDFSQPVQVLGLEVPPVALYYYLFLLLVVGAVVVCTRLADSRIGRAWMAIREDEVAARAMGVNTHQLKLMAFAMGASFGGISGALFAAFQGFVSPESFTLMESVMIVAMVVLGGLGQVRGAILGALLLAGLPEVLRYIVGPLQAWSDGRIDAGILRQGLVAVSMIVVMLLRPRGLWPARSAPPPRPKSRAP
jgi:branched-chain amino acid transport system permease protein